MIDWIDVNDELPQDGEWVLGYFPDRPWGAGEEKWRHKCVVVVFNRGISIAEREAMPDCDAKRRYSGSDEHGNNLVPYSWNPFGPGSMFGQECAKWARLEMEGEA